MISLLKSVYSEHEWLEWEFKHVPKNWWKDVANQRKYLDWVSRKLGISQLSQWYNIEIDEVRQLGGMYSLLKVFTGACRPKTVLTLVEYRVGAFTPSQRLLAQSCTICLSRAYMARVAVQGSAHQLLG
jgi:hypothetical protein